MQGRRRAASTKITATSLNNIALHYLERFASSAENLRRVLMRRVRRAAAHHGGDPAEGAALIEALIRRFEQSGLLDDQRYAAAKAASLQRRGGSRRAISGRLAQQGVATELIAETLQELANEPGSGDLAAACAFIRRRRLGAYRSSVSRAAAPERDMVGKDMAALARAGFSFEIARRVLACADVASVEALLSAAEEA
ncbi:MAG TPA: regulatory protein RecX [Stellaceae bacterium]|nr:regulatory protein RecX [Stellaceae bacterium]